MRTGWCSPPATPPPATSRVDGLSGLARAFFSTPGRARSSVSHWQLDDEATARITTDVFTRLSKDPSLNRAEALREAMLTLIDHPSDPQEIVPRLSGRLLSSSATAPASLLFYSAHQFTLAMVARCARTHRRRTEYSFHELLQVAAGEQIAGNTRAPRCFNIAFLVSDGEASSLSTGNCARRRTSGPGLRLLHSPA